MQKPLSPKRGNQEQKLQIALTSYMQYAFPDVLYFSVPNGGKRSVIEAAMLKKMGALAGVSDCLFFWPCGYGAIELKRPDKKAYMSPEQKEFAEKWQAYGGKFACCNSLEQCEAALKSWGLETRYKIPPMEASGRNMLQQVVFHEMMRRD